MRFETALCRTKVDVADYRSIYDAAFKREYSDTTYEIPNTSVQKIMINNIRHRHSNYDYNMRALNRTYSRDKLIHRQYKNYVLNNIGLVYPELNNTCKSMLRPVTMCRIAE